MSMFVTASIERHWVHGDTTDYIQKGTSCAHVWLIVSTQASI